MEWHESLYYKYHLLCICFLYKFMRFTWISFKNGGWVGAWRYFFGLARYGSTIGLHLPIFPSFRPMGMMGEACLPSNAYYPRTPDYTLYFGVHVWTFWFVIRLWIYEFGLRLRYQWLQLLILAYSRISLVYSSLFIIVIILIFMFSLWCIDRVGRLYANRIFMYICIKSWTQGEVCLL